MENSFEISFKTKAKIKCMQLIYNGLRTDNTENMNLLNLHS